MLGGGRRRQGHEEEEEDEPTIHAHWDHGHLSRFLFDPPLRHGGGEGLVGESKRLLPHGLSGPGRGGSGRWRKGRRRKRRKIYGCNCNGTEKKGPLHLLHGQLQILGRFLTSMLFVVAGRPGQAAEKNPAAPFSPLNFFFLLLLHLFLLAKDGMKPMHAGSTFKELCTLR